MTFTLKLLLVAAVCISVFVLATGLVEVGRVRSDGTFQWCVRVDREGLRHMGRSAWRKASGTAGDPATAVSGAAAPAVPERAPALR